jgi:hypothetical protein
MCAETRDPKGFGLLNDLQMSRFAGPIPRRNRNGFLRGNGRKKNPTRAKVVPRLTRVEPPGLPVPQRLWRTVVKGIFEEETGSSVQRNKLRRYPERNEPLIDLPMVKAGPYNPIRLPDTVGVKQAVIPASPVSGIVYWLSVDHQLHLHAEVAGGKRG